MHLRVVLMRFTRGFRDFGLYGLHRECLQVMLCDSFDYRDGNRGRARRTSANVRFRLRLFPENVRGV